MKTVALYIIVFLVKKENNGTTKITHRSYTTVTRTLPLFFMLLTLVTKDQQSPIMPNIACRPLWKFAFKFGILQTICNRSLLTFARALKVKSGGHITVSQADAALGSKAINNRENNEADENEIPKSTRNGTEKVNKIL